ncbi:MAG TPA: TldD/PmbA family protein [Acidimicrobiia bacterium]|nr:TldD/PmbA family protein [Acidimicrobiia bacterium]
MSGFDAATVAVEGALAAGARYADARVMERRLESMTARNGDIDSLLQSEDAGVGVRALVGSSWGFFATPDLGDAAARAAGGRAAEIAAASTMVPGPPLDLIAAEARVDSWASPCEEDPLSVPLAEKGDLLVAVTTTMKEQGADIAAAAYNIWETRKWLVSSEGHRIDQHIRECGALCEATVIGDGETQRRSYPGSRGQYGTRGWELVRSADLEGNGARLADEARALLSAPPCPEETTTLILDSNQVMLQIHESVGHAIEVDRILGWEAAFAGTSWLELSRLGSLRYGSELMNITADPTLSGALGSFGYDDEGTPAARRDIVKDGIWVGVLAGRDSATVAGVGYGGSVRADGWNRLPMVRMTNVGLLPGDQSLEEMIASTPKGIYMTSNRSWSIDDKRLNFQFGCEMAREVKDGQLGRILRNPTYTGIGPTFWQSMDMIGNQSEWVFWGTPNCGKGQPLQIGHTGHPAVPARFQNVRVGVRG